MPLVRASVSPSSSNVVQKRSTREGYTLAETSRLHKFVREKGTQQSPLYTKPYNLEGYTLSLSQAPALRQRKSAKNTSLGKLNSLVGI